MIRLQQIEKRLDNTQVHIVGKGDSISDWLHRLKESDMKDAQPIIVRCTKGDIFNIRLRAEGDTVHLIVFNDGRNHTEGKP